MARLSRRITQPLNKYTACQDHKVEISPATVRANRIPTRTPLMSRPTTSALLSRCDRLAAKGIRIWVVIEQKEASRVKPYNICRLVLAERPMSDNPVQNHTLQIYHRSSNKSPIGRNIYNPGASAICVSTTVQPD